MFRISEEKVTKVNGSEKASDVIVVNAAEMNCKCEQWQYRSRTGAFFITLIWAPLGPGTRITHFHPKIANYGIIMTSQHSKFPVPKVG